MKGIHIYSNQILPQNTQSDNFGWIREFFTGRNGGLSPGVKRVVCFWPQSSKNLSFNKSWALQNGEKLLLHRSALFSSHLHMCKECKEKLTFILRWKISEGWGRGTGPPFDTQHKIQSRCREHAVQKGRNRHCGFKGSEKQYFLYFIRTKILKRLWLSHSIKMKLTFESLNTPTLSYHTHLFPLCHGLGFCIPPWSTWSSAWGNRETISPFRTSLRKRHQWRMCTSGLNSRNNSAPSYQKKTSCQDQQPVWQVSLSGSVIKAITDYIDRDTFRFNPLLCVISLLTLNRNWY